MAYLTYGCCWTLLLVFAASAAGKLRGAGSFAEFRRAAAALAPAARRFAGPLAVLVVGAELTVAVLLAVPATVPIGLGAAVVLLCPFTVGIAAAVRRGDPTPCRCFGASGVPVGRRHLVRNAALLVMAAAGLLSRATWPAATTVAGLAVTASVSAVLASLVINFEALVDLFAGPHQRHDRHPSPHLEGAIS